MDIVWILLILLLSAFVAGTLGMGGGILAIPFLMLVLVHEKDHNFMKLGVYIAILALAFASLYKYFKQGRKPLWKPALLIMSGVVITSVLTNYYIDLPTRYFNLGYALVVFVVIVLLLFSAWIPRFKTPFWTLPLMGLMIGAIGGTFGLSGGVLFVPVFTILLSQQMKDAAISSVLCKIMMATSALITLAISGTFSDVVIGTNNYWLFAIIPVALSAGYFGAIINQKLPHKSFKLIFILLLVAILILKTTLVIIAFT